MAIVNVFDNSTGLTRVVSLDIAASTIKGSQQGKSSYYITVSTSVRDPSGNAIPTLYVTDFDITDDITASVNATLVELFKYMLGQYESSSSSSTYATSDVSTLSSMLSSQSNSSSSQLEGTSSSLSTSSMTT